MEAGRRAVDLLSRGRGRSLLTSSLVESPSELSPNVIVFAMLASGKLKWVPDWPAGPDPELFPLRVLPAPAKGTIGAWGVERAFFLLPEELSALLG